MKIVIINGSPRKNGATAQILNEIASHLLKKENLEIQYFHVADMKINFCIGCCYCYKEGKCFMKDELENLSNVIDEADGIIIGSPTYASDISAQLKAIIDRGHFIIEQLLHNKYAMNIVTYENYGGKDTIKNINKVLSYSGAKISAQILLKLPFSSQPFSHKRNKIKLYKKTDYFYNDILYKKYHFFQHIKHFLIFHMGIVPFVKYKGNHYNGVINHWKKRGII